MPNIHINYLAVLVAAIAAFALGALWYSPILFAKQWMKAHGYSEADAAEMRKGANRAYLITFLCQLVIALVLAILIEMIGIYRPIGGVKLGALCWLGFAATIGLTSQVFSNKRFAVYAIDVAYQLVYLVLMGWILAMWP